VTTPGDTPTLRKARGAFFTPPELAQYVTDWAVRSTSDRVLEPSCGEAAFLLSAVRRLTALRTSTPGPALPRLDGVELHQPSAEQARALLAAAGVDACIQVGDFFEIQPTGAYDAVVGNPPFVRYQDFAKAGRARSREAALRAGVPLNGLASSWAAFTVHATLFLRPGGRLGLVLPAELLSVNYAAPVRRFLLESFERVDLVVFHERVFPEVLEEVVLLLAEGYQQGPSTHCSIYEAHNADDLGAGLSSRRWRPATREGKWTPSLMPADSLEVYASVGNAEHFTVLQTWGETTLGMVTGNNKYFALSPAQAAALTLATTDVLPLSPPGSRHLRTLSLSHQALKDLGTSGSATLLFRPPAVPSAAAREYVRLGESLGIHRAYKCRVREPWWRVPLVRPADLLLTYMNADTPRLSTNRARAHHLNSVHGVYLQDNHRRLGSNLLPLASLNSMTLLGAETVGRAYGGGMLKLEPTEADRLPVPSPSLLGALESELMGVRPAVRRFLKRGRLLDAVRLVDEVVLVDGAGLTQDQLVALRRGHLDLSTRRCARGTTRRV
jgi:adenine-specific DNA-methyltransferase